MNSKNHSVLSIFTALVIALTFSACTKDRDEKIPDELQENLIEKSLLENSEVTIETEGGGQALVASRRQFLAAQEVQTVKVTNVNAPDKLLPMFQDLSIQALPGRTYRLKFQVDESFVTASLLLNQADLSSLSKVQQAIATKMDDNSYLLPIFKYAVQELGTLTRVRNDLEEDTHILRLVPSTPARATHVQVSIIPERRRLVSMEQDDSETIFVRTQFERRVLSAAELKESLGIEVVAPTEASRYYLETTRDSLRIFEVRQLQTLTAQQQAQVLAGDRDAQRRSNELARCSQDIQEQAAQVQNCVAVLRYTSKISYVTPRLEAERNDGTGPRTANIEQTPVRSGITSAFVRIDKNPTLTDVNVDANLIDQDRVLYVKQLKGVQFLFQRTLTDTPNLVGDRDIYSGINGKLQIVRFEFGREFVTVVGADPIVSNRGATAIDNPPLMSFPVKYKRKKERDGQGNLLPQVVYENAQNTDEDAIAEVTWEANNLDDVTSPLYSRCLGTKSGVQTSGFSSVLGADGNPELLGFNLRYVYEAQSMRCISRAGFQVAFDFQERVSFKKYVERAADPAGFDIPWAIQPLLGYGIFVDSVTVPSAFGRVNLAKNERVLPNIQDFRNGRVVTYVLAGLPASGMERDIMIETSREVIGWWNQAFQRAFSGTSLSRSGNFIELKIEGVDELPPRQFGDLDRNYIWYIPKVLHGSGILGLGGFSANPKNGFIENSSIQIFGGNFLASLEAEYDLAKRRAGYLARKHAIANQEASTLTVFPSLVTNVLDPEDLAKAARDQLRNTIGSIGTAGALGGSRFQQLTANRNQFLANLQIAPAGKQAMSPAVEEKVLSYLNSMTAQRAGSREEEEFEARQAHRLEKISRLAMPANRENGNAGGEELAGHSHNGRTAFQHTCALQTNALGGMHLEMGDEISAGKTEKVFRAFARFALSHELGHNFGLAHNFMGSFDKDNWKVSSSALEVTHRKTSTVMDYLRMEDSLNLDSVGPYDIAAVRLAYTGYLEVDAKWIEANLKGSTAIPVKDEEPLQLVNGKLINISDYKELAQLEDWDSLSYHRMQEVKLKRYGHCTDRQVGLFPGCAMMDHGTTYEELVTNTIDRIDANYELMHFPSGRRSTDFNESYLDYYIDRTIYDFGYLRSFVDNFFYLYQTGVDDRVDISDVNTLDSLKAAEQARAFFHRTIRTPDLMPTNYATDSIESSRFSMWADQNANILLTEEKPLYDKYREAFTGQLRYIGTTYAKQIALNMLIIRRPSVLFKDSRASGALQTAFSFIDMEQILMKEVSIPNLPSMALLQEVLRNNLMASTLGPVGPDGAAVLVPLDAGYYAEASPMARTAVALATIVLDDTSVVDQNRPNFSEGFRMVFGSSPPGNVPWVSREQYKAYWSLTQSSFASWFVENQSGIAKLLVEGEKAAPIIAKYFGTKALLDDPEGLALLQGEIPETQVLVQDMAEAKKALEELMQKLPESLRKGRDAQTMLDIGVSFLDQWKDLGTNFEEAMATEDGEKAAEYAMFIVRATNFLRVMAARDPLLAYLVQNLPAEQMGAKYLVPRQEILINLNRYYQERMNVIEGLSMMFYYTHDDFYHSFSQSR